MTDEFEMNNFAVHFHKFNITAVRLQLGTNGIKHKLDESFQLN
jgi:hypothetical protein